MKKHIAAMIEGKTAEQIRALAGDAEDSGLEILSVELSAAAAELDKRVAHDWQLLMDAME